MFPYPPVSGGLIKTFNTITTLAQEHDVRAVFITDSIPSPTSLKHLTSMGISVKYFVSAQIRASLKEKFWDIVWCYLRGIPFYVYQYTHAPVFPYVEREIARFRPDIIHVDHLNLSQYLPQIKHQTWILEHHNVESYLYWTRLINARKFTRFLYLLIETVLTYMYEFRTLKRFDHVFAISKPEELRLRKLFGVRNVSTQPMTYTSQRITPQKHKGKNMVFVGVLDWPPNEDAVQWFIEDILPRVVERVPDVRFHIIGRLGPRYVPKSSDHVFVQGFQQNLITFLSYADVFVLPFRMGGGLRLKALTALSSGIPVVTTPLGIEGVGVTHGKECVIAITPKEFSEAVVTLLQDAPLRKKLRQNAVFFMGEAYGPENEVAFLSVYNAVTR